jgi:3'-5' exonuclease
MIKSIAHINTEKVIAIDIETVRIGNNFSNLPESFQEAWGYKNKHEGEVPDNEELEKLWEKQASLYAEFSKVCAVSLAFISKGNLRVKNYASYDEKMILLALSKDLQKFDGYRLCAHAGKYFDYPFLCKRYVINSIGIPSILDSSHLKPWEQSNLDTNEIWKSFGTGPGSSLVALCTALGIETPKADLVGDEVGKAYYNNELVRISKYCNLDAVACMNVLLKFKGEPTFLFGEVAYVNEGELLPNFLDKIYQTKQITSDDFAVIKTFAENLDPKHVDFLQKMLTAAVLVGKDISLDNRNFIEQL